MMMKGPNQIEPCCQMQPPIGGGAPSHFEQEMMPVTMRPPFPPPPTYQPPIGAESWSLVSYAKILGPFCMLLFHDC
ncbi:hypothetical protein MKX03_005079 [Papaver bracteatum]|nr:hypothetical protein MKX03_005079 [Papaver bracteatum]